MLLYATTTSLHLSARGYMKEGSQTPACEVEPGWSLERWGGVARNRSDGVKPPDIPPHDPIHPAQLYLTTLFKDRLHLSLFINVSVF